MLFWPYLYDLFPPPADAASAGDENPDVTVEFGLEHPEWKSQAADHAGIKTNERVCLNEPYFHSFMQIRAYGDTIVPV